VSKFSPFGQVILFDQFYVSFDFPPSELKRKRNLAVSAHFDSACYCIFLDHALLFYQGFQVFGVITFRKSSKFFARLAWTAQPLMLQVMIIEWTAIDGMKYKIQLAPCSDLEKRANTCDTWIRKLNTHFRFIDAVHDWPIIIEDKVDISYLNDELKVSPRYLLSSSL
jgi:hypothetical protein